MSVKLTDTLSKKWDIAKRICDPLNDKRFHWEKQEDGTFTLSGISTLAVYRDVSDEKNKKGFMHFTAGGKKVLQASTLNVGIFIRSIKPSLEEAMAPDVKEATATPANGAKAETKKAVKATA